MSFTERHLAEAVIAINGLDRGAIDRVVELIVAARDAGGRLFCVGVGGSAANCSHAVNDFRMLCGIESYAPTDNVAEVTARTNDAGWDHVFVEWLRTSRLAPRDLVFVMSVGGGSDEHGISANLVHALRHAKEVGAPIVGIVGRDGGFTKQVANACVVVPTVNPESITPHVEALQAVVWHLLVTHPSLKRNPTKWESVDE